MHALIVGRRFQGKSTLALSLGLSQRSTVVVWDPNAQYRDLPNVQISALPMIFDRYPSIAVRVTRDDYAEAFDQLGRTLWDYADYCLLVDEAATLQTAHSIDPMLKRYVTRAPASVCIIQTAHRISDFNQVSQAQATDLFFFRTTGARDLERIEDEYGADVAAPLPKLSPYEVMHHWRDPIGGQEFNSSWKQSELWFIEIGREDGQVLRQANIASIKRRESQTYAGNGDETQTETIGTGT